MQFLNIYKYTILDKYINNLCNRYKINDKIYKKYNINIMDWYHNSLNFTNFFINFTHNIVSKMFDILCLYVKNKTNQNIINKIL